jgi:hypothetical protein
MLEGKCSALGCPELFVEHSGNATQNSFRLLASLFLLTYLPLGRHTHNPTFKENSKELSREKIAFGKSQISRLPHKF